MIDNDNDNDRNYIWFVLTVMAVYRNLTHVTSLPFTYDIFPDKDLVLLNKVCVIQSDIYEIWSLQPPWYSWVEKNLPSSTSACKKYYLNLVIFCCFIMKKVYNWCMILGPSKKCLYCLMFTHFFAMIPQMQKYVTEAGYVTVCRQQCTKMLKFAGNVIIINDPNDLTKRESLYWCVTDNIYTDTDIFMTCQYRTIISTNWYFSQALEKKGCRKAVHVHVLSLNRWRIKYW